MHPYVKRPLATALVLASVLAPASAFAEEAIEPAQPAITVPAPMPTPMPPMPSEGPALAEVKIDREQAIAIVKKLVNISSEFGEPNVHIYQSQTGATWSLNWQTPRNKPDMGSISAEVDAVTGNLIAFWRYRPWSEEEMVLALTRNEGLKHAEEWMQKVAGTYAKALRLEDQGQEFGYGYGYYGGGVPVHHYRWARYERGYIVRDEGFTITINAVTGELENFHINWNHNATFTTPKVPVDLDKAKNAYRNQVEMKLFYQKFYKPFTDDGEWRLVYQPINGMYPTVTLDGKLGDYSGQPLDLSRFQWKQIPAPDRAYSAPASPLTQEQALAQAKAITGRTDEPTGSSYGEWGDTTKNRTWDFSWYPQGEMKEGDLATSVQINVDTGLVTNMSSWGLYQERKADEKPTFTLEQAQEKAINFLRTHRPDLAANAVMINDGGLYREWYGPISNYYVRFQILHNGIPVNGYEVSMDIDAFAGEIRYFWASSELTDGSTALPTAEGAITPATAIEAFLTHQGLVAAWTHTPPAELDAAAKEAGMPIPMPTISLGNTMHLIFAPNWQTSIAGFDAKTGAPLDYQGRNLVELAKRPSDIEGHFAQREIELFWQRGIFELEDGKFRPNDAATGADLARWLVMAKGLRPYPMYDFAMVGRGGSVAAETAAKQMASSDNAAYWGAALQAGILLPEDFTALADPEGEVSRQQFALWAVRAMGYGRVAKIANKIEIPFADASAVSPSYANAVALLHGLGAILGDSNTTYEPGKAITRGEAAKIIFSVATEARR